MAMAVPDVIEVGQSRRSRHVALPNDYTLVVVDWRGDDDVTEMCTAGARPDRRRAGVAARSLSRGVLGFAIALVTVTTACTTTTTTGPAPSTAGAMVPPSLVVPPAHHVVLDASVQRGSQVYVCARGAWAMPAPAAVLTAPGTDVLHTVGPRWIATADGSAVTATPVATVAVPGAAPELLLRATEHDGAGILAGVDFVQRLATRGGAAPTDQCVEGERRAVDYAAEYRFSAPDS